jgi:hypothetical protein
MPLAGRPQSWPFVARRYDARLSRKRSRTPSRATRGRSARREPQAEPIPTQPAPFGAWCPMRFACEVQPFFAA